MKKKKLFSCITLLTLIILLFCIQFVSASTIWQKNFATANDDDCAYAITPSNNGGYVMAVDADTANSYGPGSWLYAIDSSGNLEWKQIYCGLGNDELFSVASTNDMGYIAAGYTGLANGDNYAWLLKTDSQGNLEWNQTYGSQGDNRAFSVIQTSDGGYVFTGYTEPSDQGNRNFWLIKTDSQGNLLWNQTYGGAGNDQAYDLVQANDGGFAIAGQTNSFGDGRSDAWLIKTDSSGNLEWNKTYGKSDDDGVFSIIQTNDGGYALAGYSFNGQNICDAWIIKTDSSGNMEWQKTLNSGASAQALSVIQTQDGGYILAGYTDSYGPVGSQIWLDKINADGNNQWSQTIGGKTDDGAFALTNSNNETCVVAGYTGTLGNDSSEVWVAQVNANTAKPSLTLYFGLPLITAIAVICILVISVQFYRTKRKKVNA